MMQLFRRTPSLSWTLTFRPAPWLHYAEDTEAMYEVTLRKRQERAEFWCVPELGDAEALYAHYHDHRFERHAHAQFAISVVDRGAGSFRYRGGKRTAPAGSLVTLESGQKHTGEVVSDGDTGLTR